MILMVIKIAVTGGKGGTGKSIIAVNLAVALTKLGKKVTYLDCDADCPSANFLFSVNLKNKRTITSFIPKIIDNGKCVDCKDCVASCESKALFNVKGRAPLLLSHLCNGCKACKIVCPIGLIEDDEKVIGWTYYTEVNGIELFSGELKPSEPQSERIVSAVKERAEKEGSGEVYLIDSAAGAHCPVVAAVEDCDKALVITEPTLFGESDLGSISELLKSVNIPYEIIVNRSDISNKKISGNVLEIPYSKEMIECYTDGVPIVEKYPNHPISKKIIEFSKELIK